MWGGEHKHNSGYMLSRGGRVIVCPVRADGWVETQLNASSTFRDPHGPPRDLGSPMSEKLLLPASKQDPHALEGWHALSLGCPPPSVWQVKARQEESTEEESKSMGNKERRGERERKRKGIAMKHGVRERLRGK